MAGLVDDLFELSRIHAGRLEVSLHAVSLGDVVSDAVASALPVARAKGVRLEAQEGGYARVRGSEPELGRVMGNLLLNAIRHTPADGVVTVRGGADDRSGWVAVSDGCGGIPDADLPRVFDVAFRGEAARSPAPQRQRRGLSPAGADSAWPSCAGSSTSIRATSPWSTPSDGCRFTVRLPVATA